MEVFIMREFFIVLVSSFISVAIVSYVFDIPWTNEQPPAELSMHRAGITCTFNLDKENKSVCSVRILFEEPRVELYGRSSVAMGKHWLSHISTIEIDTQRNDVTEWRLEKVRSGTTNFPSESSVPAFQNYCRNGLDKLLPREVQDLITGQTPPPYLAT